MRILIADDHPIVRRGLRDLILESFPFAEVVEVGDAEELMKKVFKEEYDIVITDLSMPGRSGMDALQQIKKYYLKLPVLVLSVYPEEEYAIRALKEGAAGYLNKDQAIDELVNAIHQIRSGKKYITPAVAQKLASDFNLASTRPTHENLSNREFEILKFLAAGKSISEIAASLFLSVTTVSTYRARILSKMQMKSNADLIKYAIEHKLG